MIPNYYNSNRNPSNILHYKSLYPVHGIVHSRVHNYSIPTISMTMTRTVLDSQRDYIVKFLV